MVISQVFGGGGNAGAPYNQDYMELFNGTGSAVNLTGYTIQYAAANASTQSATLSGSIASGKFFLIGLATGAVGSNLPAVDATGTFNMSATAR